MHAHVGSEAKRFLVVVSLQAEQAMAATVPVHPEHLAGHFGQPYTSNWFEVQPYTEEVCCMRRRKAKANFKEIVVCFLVIFYYFINIEN